MLLVTLPNSIKAASKFKKKFKSFNLQLHDENIGLAKNIILSIDKYIKIKKKLIILEDDIVTSPSFLSYMNFFLNHFNDTNIWHISGYVPEIFSKKLQSFFLTRMMQCWGWATWETKWKYFRKDPIYFYDNFSKQDIYEFNLENIHKYNWKQILENKDGTIDTWAIFWHATIFKNNGLCLSPNKSYIKNIGFDGSGEHCHYEYCFNVTRKLNTNENFSFDQNLLQENYYAFNLLKKYYKSRNNILNRIGRRVINTSMYFLKKSNFF